MPTFLMSNVSLRSFAVVEQLPGVNDCGFYAVYDGHGGDVSSLDLTRLCPFLIFALIFVAGRAICESRHAPEVGEL